MNKRLHRIVSILFSLPKAAVYCWCLCCLMTLQATGATLQELDETFTFSRQQLKAGEVVNEIEKSHKLRFTYGEAAAALMSKPVTLQNRTVTLKAALEAVKNATGLQYDVNGRYVVLQPAPPGAVAQPAPLRGKVTDARNGTPLPGVTIKVKGGGTGVVTDGNGEFRIRVSGDKIVLQVSYIGYQSKEVKVGNPGDILQITLKEEHTRLGEVEVTASKKTNTEIATLNERKNAAIVQDAISAAQIAKSASITTTQALQRVTGVTITDDKYVAVRGLGDRSVIAQLNGARLSSSDPDRSTVPLDLIPAALLDNATVYKTMTPDKPADAAAGIIELKTKSVPDSLMLEFTSQIGVNSSVGLGGSYTGFRNNDLGFLGQKVKTHNLTPEFNQLKDLYPGGLPEIQNLFRQSRNNPALAAEAYRINGIMQRFDPVLTTSQQPSVLNQIYTASFGNSYRVFKKHKLGVIISANYYRRTEDRYDATLNQYSIYQGILTGSDKREKGYESVPRLYNPLHVPPFITPDHPRLGKYLGYRENSGVTSLSYGILAGVTYRFNARHQIQAQYIGSSGAEASAANLNGAWENTGLQYPVYNYVNQLKQSYRKFNTFNFQGEHQLIRKEWSPRVGYNLSASTSSQNEPDFRFSDVAMSRATRLQDPAGTGVVSDLYSFVSGSVHGIGPNGMILADPNGRKFRKLDEQNYNAKVDVTQPVSIGGRQQLFKAGYNYLRRERDFTENVMGLPGSSLGGDNGQLDRVKGRLDELISYGNIGLKDPGGYDDEGQPRVGGFLYQIRKSPNNYIGTYETQAFYGMIDARIGERLRLTGGVRFESTDIRAKVDTSNVFNPLVNGPLTDGNINTGVSTSRPNTGLKASFKPYYSANLTYAYRNNMNFRLGYSTTLARPELRELTNIYEFDPFQFAVVVGNPDLKNQLTRSVDFRWEWFPHSGEVIAASVFGKQIESQLTKTFSYSPQGSKALAPEFPVVAYRNDPNRGQLFGIELEVRKNLGVLTPALRQLFLGANVMFASSSITKNAERVEASRAIDRNASDKSPLFEQAPYSVNAYLDYDNPRYGTSLMASFNIVGERLIQVQLDGTPDLYSRPAPMLDFVFSQRLMKRFTLKGFAKNILNPAFREVYATPRSNGLYHGVRYIRHEYYRGTEYSLGLTYRLL